MTFCRILCLSFRREGAKFWAQYSVMHMNKLTLLLKNHLNIAIYRLSHFWGGNFLSCLLGQPSLAVLHSLVVYISQLYCMYCVLLYKYLYRPSKGSIGNNISMYVNMY